MNDKRDKEGNLLSDTERLTRVGGFMRKKSIDELPQLFNVIRGDLSIVGPRPLLPQYLLHYNKRQARRHDVKPGITGWAQVNGRQAISFEDRFELDVWYVDNISFRTDVIILFKTFVNVLKSKGVIENEGYWKL
jgi:lipopolysaccharide/colanic/teichoic acid biosynthesis glycosyltransferase